MLGAPSGNGFWGKLNRDHDNGLVSSWHPLIDHCADVAAVAEALLELPIWQKRFSRFAGRNLTIIDRARLCVLTTLHDIGKLNLGFQAKGRVDLEYSAGHVLEALGVLCQGTALQCLSEIEAWGQAVEGLLVTAICHHGQPYKCDAGKYQATWWRVQAGLDPLVGAEDLFKKCHEWFPQAFTTSASPLPKHPEFEHVFAGLVMLADWLGSDTKFFPFSNDDTVDRMPWARVQAHAVVTQMNIDYSLPARHDAAGRDAFSRIAPKDFKPKPAQRVTASLPLDGKGSITVLESETGSGKTEAALARFVALFEAGLVDGMYFALPTRSAATELHRRVYEAVKHAFVAPPRVILAVPGYLRADDVEGTKLAPFEVLWPDKDRWRYRAWAAENPKRYLAGCIIVGTIDQILLSSLMVGHAHLRAVALLRHLLIVDEVHASDAYMGRILREVLQRHYAAGGHSLLLSATLGSEARARLLHPETLPEPIPIDQAIDTPYPLVSHRSTLLQHLPTDHDDNSRTVQIRAEPWLESYDTLAEQVIAAAKCGQVIAAAKCGAKVLVIKNTVNDCIETQLAVERAASAHNMDKLLFRCTEVAAPHHARFARVDREALDHELERRFGKTRAEGGCIIVATQTVQQSLDLDADILFTDLCPADVLLQRIGRLHRHVRPRPLGFEQPQTVVVVPADRDLGVLLSEQGRGRHHHGLGSVYDDLRILEATWRLIEKYNEWRIPAMNRMLIERSLHSSVLADIVGAGGPRWDRHSMEMLGQLYGETRQAELNIVDWSKPYSETNFPSKLDQRIATRLGEGDRRVRFIPAIMSPFGNSVDELTLRASWTSNVPVDTELASAVCHDGGETQFSFGEKNFVYDRLGLRPVT